MWNMGKDGDRVLRSAVDEVRDTLELSGQPLLNISSKIPHQRELQMTPAMQTSGDFQILGLNLQQRKDCRLWQ